MSREFNPHLLVSCPSHPLPDQEHESPGDGLVVEAGLAICSGKSRQRCGEALESLERRKPAQVQERDPDVILVVKCRVW